MFGPDIGVFRHGGINEARDSPVKNWQQNLRSVASMDAPCSQFCEGGICNGFRLVVLLREGICHALPPKSIHHDCSLAAIHGYLVLAWGHDGYADTRRAGHLLPDRHTTGRNPGADSNSVRRSTI